MRDHATLDTGCEATQVGVQPSPGAVFLKLRRRRGGRTTRSMFVEMTIGEAGTLLRELDASLRTAIQAM